jgi:DNA-binding Lrp family transcriptional regulator
VQNVHHLAVDVEARMMDALDRAILRRLQQDGRQDVLIHVAVPDTPYLRDFVLDQLARRKEIVDVRTTVVYEYIRPVEQSELPAPR